LCSAARRLVMSDKLKIKISIADRVYPLNVDYSQEEALRAASKKIDAMIKQFEQNYAVRDKQDVLAMCALQFASQIEQKGLDTVSINDDTKNKLLDLNELLTKYLERS
jgi:cell division protein ZapA